MPIVCMLILVQDHMLQKLPAERLLLETDEPPTEGFTWSADAWRTRLEETLAVLAAARGEDASALGAAIAATSARLLEA